MGKPDMWNRLVRVMQGLNVAEYPLLPRKSKLEVICAIAQESMDLLNMCYCGFSKRSVGTRLAALRA